MSVIILVKPRNPLNIGAAARAMANFGFEDLRVVSPYPPVWEEAISAVGAQDIIKNAKVFNTLENAMADCNFSLATTSLKNRKLTQKLVSLPDIKDVLKGKTAVVFGPEKTGLTNEEIELCSAVLNIPTTSKTPSINMAQAVILVCWEMAKALNFTRPKKTRKINAATIKDNEILVGEAEKLLNKTAFKHALTASAKRALIREMLSQKQLTKNQVFMLKNLAFKINEKIAD